MKEVYKETKRTLLSQEIRYSYWEMKHPRCLGIKIRSRLHNFKEMVEGQRFVDGEYICDWVKYV